MRDVRILREQLLWTPFAGTIAGRLRRQIVERRLDASRAGFLLVHYPKSGSTWLRMLLSDLHASADADFDQIRELFPPLTERHATPASDVVGAHSHDWARAIPETTKVLYLVRDARDVASSYWRHLTALRIVRAAEPEFIQRLATHPGLGPHGSWSEHVVRFLDGDAAGRFHGRLVRYEDLRDNPVTVLEDIARFAGIPATTDAVRSAVARQTKDHVRSKPKSTGLSTWTAQDNWFVSAAPTHSSETTGPWRDLARRHAEVMTRLGYSID